MYAINGAYGKYAVPPSFPAQSVADWDCRPLGGSSTAVISSAPLSHFAALDFGAAVSL